VADWPQLEIMYSESHSQPVIHAEGLARSFGDRAAVAGLDLDVRRGEMFGLVGPDGAGKSTAIRLLCGILKPTGGRAKILGYDVYTEAEKIKARIGYLSQRFTLYGDLTVDENIEFFADLHGVADFERRRGELLDFTRLTPFRNRLAAVLSGGMKKKLALACTLIHTPDVVFLDEPSTGVDPVSRGEFWNILSGILEQGVSIFMTTPYLDEAERCTSVGLMHEGRMFRVGTPESVRAGLPGRMVDIQCARTAEAYAAMRGLWPSTRVVRRGESLRFHSEEGDRALKDCVGWLEREGYGPVRQSVAVATLEDVFVALLAPKSE
jgi:ABC-2 type transport system ATP-binding protein